MNNSIKNIFKADPATGASTFRLYLMRLFYVVLILLLGIQVWTVIFTHQTAWQPLPAVAFSFWGGLTLLAVLGLVHPLKMIPLLLIKFTYKLIWLIMVAYPLWTAGHLAGSAATELTRANLMGIVLDLLVIPWPYVLKNYILPASKIK